LVNSICKSAYLQIGTLLVLACTSCGDGMLNEYLNSDSLIWTNANVYVDSTGYAEITVQENGNGPELTVYYGCEEYDIDKLYKINADLIVDGKVLTPTYDSLVADYSGFSVSMPSNTCCAGLAEKMAIDSSQYMESFSFGIQISKKYADLNELPKQLSVHFTSESAGGNTDTTIALTLRSSKDSRAPIRIH
jgi:hypothetical protein